MGLEGWGQAGAKQFGGVQIFDAERGSLVRSIAEEEPTTFVGYSHDGKLVASSSNAGPVRLWDTATGEVARIFRGAKAAFSPDGGSIACASMEWNTQKTEAWGKVNLYDLKTARLIKTFTTEKPTVIGWLLSVAFSPDGRRLAATAGTEPSPCGASPPASSKRL